MLSSGTTNPMLLARAQNEEVWIDKVAELSNNHYAVIEWKAEDISGDALSLNNSYFDFKLSETA
jgi:arsenite-transporting ATPase